MRRLGFGIVLIGLAVAAFVAFRFVHGRTETGPAMKDITLVVPEGSTIADAAILLKQKGAVRSRSEEHTSELQSLMRISYAVFCLKTKKLTTIPSYLSLTISITMFSPLQYHNPLLIIHI